jgi:RNA ligase (TIGR02306 family)
VRQIRIRKLASQGMLVDPADIEEVYGAKLGIPEQDYAAILNITKYEPPETFVGLGNRGPRNRNKKNDNADFHKYNGLENIKWYPEKFKEDENVVIQEKIHGTNARAGMLPYGATTLWKKIKRFFNLTPKYEFCYGSNNVQLHDKPGHAGFYGSDVYGQVFNNIDAKGKLKPGETVYGEIYGYGIQANYTYGCAPNEHRFALFDVKILNEDGSQKWLNPDEVVAYAKDRGFDMVPELYRGKFNLELAKSLTKGDSVLCPSQKVREGVVVKSLDNYDEYGNKRALKIVSEEYLDDSSNTDNH